MIPIYKNNNIAKSGQTKDASKYPQGYFKKKPCGICESEFQPHAPSEKYCTDECKNEAHFSRILKRTYNISVAEYRLMHKEQNGVCKICFKEGFGSSNKYMLDNPTAAKLVIDHCHATNKVRGLLCTNCNTALGSFKDDKEILKRALEYLNA